MRNTVLLLAAVQTALLVWLLGGCAAGRSGDGQQEGPAQEGAEQAANLSDVSSGNIVFVDYRDGITDIFVMNADGSNERNLTHTTSEESDPVWSPDGKKIAFIRGGEYFDVFVMNADGSGQTHLTNDTLAFSQLAWSPDGKKIAFSRSDGASIGDIYVINADGTGETQLTHTPEGLDVNVGAPLWSPDGKKIAFEMDTAKATHTDSSVPSSAPVEEMSGIYVMNADGTDLHKLPDTSATSSSPALSPDGQKIAFTDKATAEATSDTASATSDTGSDIYVMNFDGTGRTRLTHTSSDESDPAWSPDGKKIAFIRDYYGVYVMNADGSNERNLTHTTLGENSPVWSLDGKKIAFNVVNAGICVINADGTDRTCHAGGEISTGAWAKR